MKNALPWIILALIIAAIIYYFYKKSIANQVVTATGAAPIVTGLDANGNPNVCPSGWEPHGDGSGCKQTLSGSLCALWGNPTLARCTGVPTLKAPAISGIARPANPNQPIASSIAVVPPIVPGALLSNASCLNTPIVVGMIRVFKESKPWNIARRLEIKEDMAAICPEGLRYLTR